MASYNQIRTTDNWVPRWAPAVPPEEEHQEPAEPSTATQVKTTGPDNWPYQLLVTVSSRFSSPRR